MTTCSNGHESEWPDYCSVCGEALAPDASRSSQAPVAGGDEAATPQCSNCQAAHRPDDVFCESCGLDFTSGTLPDEPESPGTTVTAAAPTVAVLTVDEAWAQEAIGDTGLDLPADRANEWTVALRGTKALIGRSSKTRGIFPEIDIDALTKDPAISSRHAMIERDDDGRWSITDVGSTNGTVVDDPTGEPVTAGVAVPLAMGQAVFLGAWTRLELRSESS